MRKVRENEESYEKNEDSLRKHEESYEAEKYSFADMLHF